jgi:hypothetical protein
MNQDNSVRGYVLSNGMEMIGTFESQDDNFINLKQAVVLNVRQSPDGVIVQLVPPSFFAIGDDKGTVDVQLNRDMVVFPYAPKQDLYEKYCKSTGRVIIAQAFIKI